MSKEEKMKAVDRVRLEWGLKGNNAEGGAKKEKKAKAEKPKEPEPVFVNTTPKGEKKGGF